MVCHGHERHAGYSTNLLFSSSYSSNVFVLTFNDAYYLLFENESFGVVIDKGGLNALMEPEIRLTLGNQYLSKVEVVYYKYVKQRFKSPCFSVKSVESMFHRLQDGINFIQVRKIILIFVFVMLKGSGDNNFNSSDIPSWVYVSSNPNLTTVILKDNQLSGTLNLSGGYRRSLQLIDFQNNGITELEFGNQMLNFNLR
ncbi:hypothetical protein RYX36_023814 [Vicia faba]